MMDFSIKKRRGFNLQLLSGLALSLVVLVVITVVGAILLGKLKASTSDTNASYVATKGLQATEDLGGWFGIVVVVGVGGFVIYMLMNVFRGD
jgi:multisubunit Na+/H+ antiporter MnhB subunit